LPLLVAQIEGAVRGGIDLVQIREHDLDTRSLARLAGQALHLAAGTSARVIVNDRVDVAVATGAHGVHLRELGFSSALIRPRWPSLKIGRSVHSCDALSGDAGVDYWIAGTVFPTASKASAEYLGVEGLGRIVRTAGGTPVLAIGGITAATLPRIVGSGVTGVAAIGAFMPPVGAADLVASVAKTVETLRFAFDTASSAP
jgi:thiamine-phosphate pyrophosphorylase